MVRALMQNANNKTSYKNVHANIHDTTPTDGSEAAVHWKPIQTNTYNKNVPLADSIHEIDLRDT